MAVWLRTLKRETPMVKVALFLDDRTLWSSGSAAVESVVQAARTAKALDADLGLTAQEDKLECFGTTQDAREALFEEAELVGTPQDTFKLLGVTYHVRADACRALAPGGSLRSCEGGPSASPWRPGVFRFASPCCCR